MSSSTLQQMCEPSGGNDFDGRDVDVYTRLRHNPLVRQPFGPMESSKIDGPLLVIGILSTSRP